MPLIYAHKIISEQQSLSHHSTITSFSRQSRLAIFKFLASSIFVAQNVSTRTLYSYISSVSERYPAVMVTPCVIVVNESHDFDCDFLFLTSFHFFLAFALRSLVLYPQVSAPIQYVWFYHECFYLFEVSLLFCTALSHLLNFLYLIKLYKLYTNQV